jgi:segregation and condensation protein A
MAMAVEFFEEDGPRDAAGGDRLVLDLDGYEGPLDLLLTLARDQKVDVTKISILALAEQYLAFIERAKELRLEVAADYLVMGAWLAYLKSRLLLPKAAGDDEPSGPEMAAALKFQLARLEAMREAGARLMARDRLGTDFHKRGAPEEFKVVSATVFDVSLYDLLRAYADQKRRSMASVLHIKASNELYSVEDARLWLSGLVGTLPDWRTLMSFLPESLRTGLNMRSAVAAAFAASLDLAKAGELELRQDTAFGPIYIKGRRSGQ